jgi:hypothetical protein
VFDVYQHKTLPQFRTIVPSGAWFPAEGQPENWRKVRTVERSQLSPEAAKEISEKGYYCYQPKVTFKEIEVVEARETATRRRALQ